MPPPTSDEQKAHIREVYTDPARGNFACGATARICGTTPETVRKVVEAAGLPRRGPGGDMLAMPALPLPPIRSTDAANEVEATRQRLATLPEPSSSAGGPQLPDPIALEYKPVQIDTPGPWLVLNDTHIPFHDRKTIELAVVEARRRQAAGVLLNGDILDCGEVSEHDKDPDSIDLVDEVEKGKQFIGWLRSQLPAARILYKEGNHDNRVPRYVLKHAPALFKLAGVGLSAWLELDKSGVEWVDGKRVVRLGRLNVIHGHEYKGGGGVSPARWLYLKARSVAMCGHFHRSSAHDSKNIEDVNDAAWSVGCACYLHPAWLPLNDWNHGFAMVTLESDGWFTVENKRVISGRVV